jgi:hypothetical protein
MAQPMTRGRSVAYRIGQPPCASITASISPMMRIVSSSATTTRW